MVEQAGQIVLTVLIAAGGAVVLALALLLLQLIIRGMKATARGEHDQPEKSPQIITSRKDPRT